MCLGVLALSACSSGNTDPTTTAAASTPDKQTSNVETPTPTPTPTEVVTPSKQTTPSPSTTDEPETPTPLAYEDVPDFVNVLKRQVSTDKHTTLEELPSSFTLVGSEFLPAPMARGDAISCQAADAITYMQFTNAVARYERSLNPDSTWKPAEDFNSCYSPKFTAQYANYLNGSYDILIDNGCLTIAQDDFARSALKTPIILKNGKYQTQTTGWQVGKGVGEEALKYRLLRYSPISTSNKDNTTITTGYYDLSIKGVNITQSSNGAKFLEKVKDAIATGNVVVGQGYRGYRNKVSGVTEDEMWQIETLPSASGTLGKSGDSVITFSLIPSDVVDENGNVSSEKGDKSRFAYQLCIVGYDDELTITSHGAEMKGAFLVCNSGDKKWGKDGYAWLMYDALNTNSLVKNEDGTDAFKLEEGQYRMEALDYFSFIYWDCDITNKLPQLYAEVELEADSRNGFYFTMTKIRPDTPTTTTTSTIASEKTRTQRISISTRPELQTAKLSTDSITFPLNVCSAICRKAPPMKTLSSRSRSFPKPPMKANAPRRT